MNISQILNARVYLDGTNDLLGRAATVTLPDVSVATEALRGLGMIGSVEVPTGLEALVTKIKWNGFYPDVLGMSLNPFVSHKLQVRASLETYGPGGRIEEKAVECLLTVSWKKTPLGAMSPGGKQESEDELPTTYIKLTVGGKEVVELDVHNNIWKVAGKDVLETYRKNLGG